MEVDSGRNCGIFDDVGEHMEFCSNGVCSDLRNRNILEMVAKDIVPSHLTWRQWKGIFLIDLGLKKIPGSFAP